eukprot:Gb_36618 [translate_table: standard]
MNRKNHVAAGDALSSRRRYRGVQFRSWGKWVAENRSGKRSRIWLGSYFTPEAAARAYDTALLLLRGPDSSHFNFPDACRGQPIEVPSSNLSPESIRRAAAAVRNAFDNVLMTAATKDSPTHDHLVAVLMRPEVESQEDASTTHYASLCKRLQGSDVKEMELQRCTLYLRPLLLLEDIGREQELSIAFHKLIWMQGFIITLLRFKPPRVGAPRQLRA